MLALAKRSQRFHPAANRHGKNLKAVEGGKHRIAIRDTASE
jgi:hypothetical protein